MKRLIALLRWMNERRAKFRVPLIIGTALLFICGATWSWLTLKISLTDLQLAPLFILAILVVPSLMYGGIGLSLLARSTGLRIPLAKATSISAYAYLAELLPLPGGAIIRTGALMSAGGTLRRSTALVLLTAILWVSLAMIGAGLTLLSGKAHLALPMIIAGAAFATIIYIWLHSIGGMLIAIQTLVHRIVGIMLIALRLQFAFAVLHTPISFFDTMPFALAMLLGSASSIAPAGLGISEALAALAATTTGSLPPGIAFLAVGLDRLLCLTGCACLAVVTQLGEHRHNKRAHSAAQIHSGEV